MAAERGTAPLIPDFLWPWIVPILVVLTAIVGGLSIYLYDRIGPVAFEESVMEAIYGAGIRRRVFRLGLELGSPRFFAAILVVLGIWALVRRSPAALIACVSVPAAVVFVEIVLKPLVDRTWQLSDSVPTYPSGTAAGVAAWTTLVWLLAVPAVRNGALRLGLAITLGALTVLTAISVVGDHRHFPLDALGGIAAGVGFVLACAALIDVVTGAHRAREPDPDAAASGAVVASVD